MKVAWPWVVGGLLVIGVGLYLWYTTFILVPAGVVMIGVGATKFVRARRSGPTDRE
jgi:hypothetical protein